MNVMIIGENQYNHLRHSTKFPKEYGGKKICGNGEVFRSIAERDTYDGALANLAEIKKLHSPDKGWVDFEQYVVETKEGKYVAVLVHAQYK